MGIRYGSNESIELCDDIGRTMANEAIWASYKLALHHGSYPKYNSNAVTRSEFYQNHINYDEDHEIHNVGLRNSQLLTIAPTGSLSSMLGVSGGIEPVYANYYERKTESLHGRDEYYKVYTPIVKQYMEEHGIKDDKDLPSFFVTAQTLDYKERIDMQSIWQSHIDASISSTVNVPNSFSVEDTEGLYMYAWEKDLKGVTIFRDGCKRTAILTTNKKEEEKDTKTSCSCVSEMPRGYIANVSDDLVGYKRKVTTGCGTIHLEVYSDEVTGEPQETFINIGSGGGCERNYQFISRLMSLALRAGVPIEAIIDQAMSIRPCNAYVNRTKSKHDTSMGTSCPSAIGYALKDLYDKMADRNMIDVSNEEDDEEVVININEKQTSAKCPECGASLLFEGGCVCCKNCGWSKCD
jgi:ribonucleoside-diphosphate reductase alpha chain